MRITSLSIGAVAVALLAAPVSAAPKGPTPKPTAPKVSAPKAAGPKAVKAPQAPKTTAATAAPRTHGGPKATKTTKATKPAARGPESHHGAKKTATTSTTSPGTTVVELNPIAQKISSNQGLSSKMATLLPPGMTLNDASLGFKNQGQFIAALHVSQNLGIPFADLKTAMTGIRPVTGAGATAGRPTTTEPTTLLSLGQAIKKLRGGVDADAAARAATKQASSDLSGR